MRSAESGRRPGRPGRSRHWRPVARPAPACRPRARAGRARTGRPPACASDAHPLENADQRRAQRGDHDRDHQRNRELGEEDDAAVQSVRRDRDHDQTPRPGRREVEPPGHLRAGEVRRTCRDRDRIVSALLDPKMGELVTRRSVNRSLSADVCGSSSASLLTSHPRASGGPDDRRSDGRPPPCSVASKPAAASTYCWSTVTCGRSGSCQPPSTSPTLPAKTRRRLRPAVPQHTARTDEQTDLAEVLAAPLDDAPLGADHDLAAARVTAESEADGSRAPAPRRGRARRRRPGRSRRPRDGVRRPAPGRRDPAASAVVTADHRMPRSPSTVRVTRVVATTSRLRPASSGSSSTTLCTSVVAPPTSTTTVSPATSARSSTPVRTTSGRRPLDHAHEVGAAAEVLAADDVGEEELADGRPGTLRGEDADLRHDVRRDHERVMGEDLGDVHLRVDVARDDDGSRPHGGELAARRRGSARGCRRRCRPSAGRRRGGWR